jgi:hypothetical protein
LSATLWATRTQLRISERGAVLYSHQSDHIEGSKRKHNIIISILKLGLSFSSVTHIICMQTIRQATKQAAVFAKPFNHQVFHTSGQRFASAMTTATFKYIDPTSYTDSTEPFVKPWAKVDGPGYSFKMTDRQRSVHDLHGHESEFTTDNAGFSVHRSPAKEKKFTDERAVREGYYPEVEKLLREKLSGVKRVVSLLHASVYQDCR